jgi:ketosteroid isomerase-like protein
MSKNVEILRRLYAETTLDPLKVRPELLEEFIDPQIEWIGPREFPDLGETHHGYEGIASYVAKIAEAIDDYRMAPERFVDVGNDRVLVFSREGGRGKGERRRGPNSSDRSPLDAAGRESRADAGYWEGADALEAVGLTEQEALGQT